MYLSFYTCQGKPLIVVRLLEYSVKTLQEPAGRTGGHRASSSGVMGRDKPHHIPAGGIALIQDSILLAHSRERSIVGEGKEI